jgi:hypothetical protein
VPSSSTESTRLILRLPEIEDGSGIRGIEVISRSDDL